MSRSFRAGPIGHAPGRRRWRRRDWSFRDRSARRRRCRGSFAWPRRAFCRGAAFQTSAPRQTPFVRQQVERERVLPDVDVVGGLGRSITARMTSLPVASPRAWTMRWWLWPPSRPRAQAIACSVELGAPLDQFADPLGRLRGRPSRRRRGRTGRRRPRACRRRDPRSDLPGRARRRCRLGRSCCSIAEPVLGDDQDGKLRIDGQRRPQAGQPAADDQHVGEEVRDVAWDETGPDSGGLLARTYGVLFGGGVEPRSGEITKCISRTGGAVSLRF